MRRNSSNIQGGNMADFGTRLITPDEALLLFRKLASDDTPVGCKGTLWGCSLFLFGKVSVDEESREVSFRKP